MTKHTGNRVATLRLLAAAVSIGGALAPLGCSSGPSGSGVDLPDRPDIGKANVPSVLGAPDAPAACAFPSPGCACEDGQATVCGEVLSRENNSVTCALGTRKCESKAWGSCSRENIITRQVPAGLGPYSTMGLGAPAQCQNNPCDPYCYNIVDSADGGGIDASSPIKVADGGVTLDGKPKPPDPQWKGVEVTPNANPLLITVTGIPVGQYPITDPSNPVQFKADYTPATNPPTYTNAIWSLDAYDYSLISGAGKLTVVTAVPHRPLVKATASKFTATSQAEVIVDVVESAAGIPQAILDQFNQDPPAAPGPVVVVKTKWTEPFANNGQGWTLDANPPPPPPPDVPPPPPPAALLNVQTTPVIAVPDDVTAAPSPGAKTAPESKGVEIADDDPPAGPPPLTGDPNKQKNIAPVVPAPVHLEPLPAAEPQGGTTQFEPLVPIAAMGAGRAAVADPLTPFEAAAKERVRSGVISGSASQLSNLATTGVNPPQNGEPPPPPPPCAGSYAAVKTFTDRLATTSMTLAWDGANYWSSSGGSPSGARYAKYDASGNLVGTYSPGLDFRSVFTKEGNGGTVYARQFNSYQIYQQSAVGVFSNSVALSGGALDAQSAVIFNTGSTEFNAFLGGTLVRWNTSGTYLGTVSFAGFGGVASENTYPQNRGVATAGGYYLTYSNQILSAWSAAGSRLGQSTLTGAGTGFDSHFSLSYANGLVWVVDSAGGTWRGYDLSACLGGGGGGGGGSCKASSVTFTIEQAACGGGTFQLSINGTVVKSVAPAIGCTCNNTPQVVVINDAASLALVKGSGDVYKVQLAGGSSMAYAYAKVDVAFSNGAPVTACLYDAIANGNCAARELCNGYNWDVVPSGSPPAGQCQAAAGTCTHPLFSGAPVNFTCPTGAKSFTYTGALDPASSDQAKLACEACYGAGKCFLENADCAGLGWGPNPAGQYKCGNAYFGYQNGCSGDWGRSWPICYSWANQGYGHWALPVSDSVCSDAPPAGTCAATSVTFTIEEAACGGGTFQLSINGTVVKSIAPAVGCTCNTNPMIVVISDAASLALVKGNGDKFGITLAGGSSMAYGYAKVDVAFSNAAPVSVCMFDATAGNCAARELCNGYQWDLNPSGTTPAAVCSGAAACQGGNAGTCAPSAVTFTIEEAACAGGNFLLSINGTVVKTVAPAVGCTCNNTPMVVVINDAASLALVKGNGDKFGITNPGGNTAYGYAKVDVAFSNAATVSVCMFDATGGNCAARELCNGYQWNVDPAGATPVAACGGGGGGGACAATGVTFTIEEAECAGGAFLLTINGTVVKSIAPAIGCTCNNTPMVVVINDAASLALVKGSGDKFGMTNPGGNTAYGYAKVDVTFSNAAAVSVCMFDATGGNCAARELCNGYQWNVNPSGTTPDAACKGAAAACAGACAASAATFTIEEAACGGGTFQLSINGKIVKSVAPAVGCTCNQTPMVVVVNDAASMALIKGAADKYGITLAGGSQMAYGYAKVDVTFSNGPPVSVCMFDAVAGNCAARELCNGYQWDINPSGSPPDAQCQGAAGCTHPLFSNGGGYACPTGATSFTFSGALDPASSDQAKLACEACYGAGKCFLEFADCAGGGWGPNPAGQYQCGKAYFGYANGCSGDNGRAWGICNSFTTYGWWGKPDAAKSCAGKQAEWQIGAPKASSGESYGNPDPAADHGGNNGVAGVVLGGDASQDPHAMAYLTSPVINTAAYTTANLEFWRWLNSDGAPYMVNTFDTYDGSKWANVWTSGNQPGIADASWTKQSYDVTGVKSAGFRFRFGFNVVSKAVAKVSSWNLDDIALTDTTIDPPPPADTRIQYPYANTVFPRSFTPPVLQWDSPTGKNATYVKYCLRFNDAAWPDPPNRQTFSWCYVQAEPNPKRGSFPLRAWQLFETTASGKDAKLTLQRIYNGAQLAQVEVPIRFSSEPMRGSVYYWQINTGSVNRINEDGSLTQNFLATGGRCIACHSVSADGTTLIAEMDGGNGPGGAFNTGNGAATYWRNQVVLYQGVSPNGAWTLWGENPLRLSPTTGAGITNSFSSPQAGRVVVNPAWSPLGNYISYGSRVNSGWYVDFYDADVGIIQVNPNTGAFANNKIIVTAPGGDRRVVTYPGFTPDDKFLVYQTANAIRTRGNYGNLWLTDTNGAAPTQLKKAEGIGYLDDANLNINYEPTFSPTASGGYYWLVFVSNRDYGNTIIQGAPRKDNGVKQMWVSAIDQNPNLGTDPSHPAFWLAGQQINNNNMRGAFAKSACKAANAVCAWNDDCCGYNAQDPANSTAKCVISQPVSLPVSRTCTTFVPGQCQDDGKACAIDTDCCGYPTSSCIQGLCTVPSYTQYESGTFVRDFDPQCPAGTHVTWTFYYWRAYTPGDTNIVFDAQTADTLAGLTAAPHVAIYTATNQAGNWAFQDVGSKIGLSKNYLRVNATLNPSSDLLLAPSLTDWTMQYDCIPTL